MVSMDEYTSPPGTSLEGVDEAAIGQILGYPRCHWTPPSGDYSPCIAPADTMVIDFGVKN
jgi:hypothetical protein